MARRTRGKRGAQGGPPHGVALLTSATPDGTATGSTGTRLEAMLNLIRGGTTPRRAAAAVGIPKSTWHRWMLEAGVVSPGVNGYDATNPRCPEHIRDFWDSIERARSQWVARVSVATTTGIPRNPIAGMRLLRQIDPEGQWPGDEERPPVPEPGGTRTIERQVIALPEGMVRDYLRAQLAAEAADQGDAEDDQPEEELGALAEVIVPPGARRKR